MELLGIRIDSVDVRSLMTDLLDRVEKRKKTHIVTVNPEFIIEAQKNEQFKNVLNKSDYSLIDGVGVLVGLEYLSHNSKGTKGKLPSLVAFFITYFQISFLKKPVAVDGQKVERLTGVDLIYQIVQQEWMKGRKIYLLGGEDNVSAQAVLRLKRINPDIIFRSSNGHRNIRESILNGNGEEENRKIVADITNFSPDILLVAYGHPWQDVWINTMRDNLSFSIAIGVGGSFDYVAGRVSRAPGWMRSVGLEWLYRLIRQPKRFQRIWNATWKFARLIVRPRL